MALPVYIRETVISSSRGVAVRVAVFTDEINRQDPQKAMALACEWGIEAIEIRGMPGGRFPRASDHQIREFGHWIEASGLTVSGVSPGLFKESVTDPVVAQGLESLLPRTCEVARRWGTDLVSCFGFARDTQAPTPQVIDTLSRMQEITAAAGCRLTLENEAVCWGATGTEAAQLIRQVPGLMLCWDPGNAARAGAESPFPDEYDGLRDLVSHVHVKNYNPAESRWSVMDEGPVDWPGQIDALVADQYDGFIVLETHTDILPTGVRDSGDLPPLAYNARHNLMHLRQLLGSR